MYNSTSDKNEMTSYKREKQNPRKTNGVENN